MRPGLILYQARISNFFKMKVLSLNPKTGESNWSLDGGTEKVKIHRVEETPLIIVEGEKIKLVDILTGEVYLEDGGGPITYKGNQVFPTKDKIIIDYAKDSEPMVAIVDLNDYANSVIAQMRTKGGLLSGNLRMPSSKGTVFKNKKILTCLNNEGVTSDYNSDEKSMNIIGGSSSGIATLVIKYKTFRGVDMSTCEVVWEHKSDKQPRYYVDESNNVLILARRKSFEAIDMETGELLYTYAPDKGIGVAPYFIDGHMYYPKGSTLRKFDVRTGDILLEKEYNSFIEDFKWMEGDNYLVTTKSTNRINLETLETSFDKGFSGGSIVWKEKKDNLYYYLISGLESNTLYCYENDKTRLWSNKVEGAIFKDAFLTDKGVVVATEKEFEHINDSDGKEEWDYKSTYNFAVSPHPDGGRYYGIVSSYSFHIDTKTGEFQALPKFKLKDFTASEGQSHILVSNDSYIMKSGNNFYIRGLEGEEILTKHYKRHSNASKWAKLASVATTAGAVATGNAAEVVQVSDGAGNVVHQGSLYDSGRFGRELDDARRRIANSSDLNLPFVFTKNEKKKKVFLFLDPVTGEEYKSIEVREDEPLFLVDQYDGIMFYKNKKADRLEAHMLNK